MELPFTFMVDSIHEQFYVVVTGGLVDPLAGIKFHRISSPQSVAHQASDVALIQNALQ